MATPFSDIYSRAIFRFADHDFLKQEISVREDVLEKYLISAKTDFRRICRYDLDDCDFTFKQFNQTLDDETIEILALGIAFYWLSYKSLNSSLLKNALNSRDYYYYSPGNLLKEVQTLRKTIHGEFRSKMIDYSYDNNDIAQKKP